MLCFFLLFFFFFRTSDVIFRSRPKGFLLFFFVCVFFFQLPCKAGSQTPHSRIDEEKNQKYLIQISRYRFSLVISGLTKMLQHVNEMMPYTGGPRSCHGSEHDRNCYESIIIILDTLEQCLANQPKDTTNFDETMNIKLLLREICQFISKSTSRRFDRAGASCVCVLVAQNELLNFQTYPTTALSTRT